MNPTSQARSLRTMARMVFVLNLLSAVPDGFSISILRKLFVRGDAAATAANILASEGQFRLGFVADLVSIVFFVAAMLLMYEIFRAVSRRGALLFLILVTMGAGFQALECVQDLAVLALLKGGAGTSAIPSAQANALALVFLRLHSSNYVLALFFYGCCGLVMGYLILRSIFVPRILGLFAIIEALGYLTFTLASFLSPPLVTHIYPYVPFATAAVGEIPVYFWLFFKGVNAERWQEQAAATG